ncbi:ATP-binding cassette domain-containing protein [Pasteurellaceae bacterium LIM206]|nr:ATP-binding cassette domain-containing protein [Pasteurellaceae bacterium LIM206]
MLTLRRLTSGILNNINLHLECSESVAVIGESGSGKTTLLNAIAGYIHYEGDILFNGKNINRIPVWRRNFRYLNQRLYLFPHKTIGNNLALIEKNREIQLCLLEKFRIAHLIDRYPNELSGGEQQRAALVRTLIGKPDLLLLDEPFSSLDWDTRKHIWNELKEIQRQMNVMALIVTHEPQEADFLANRKIQLHHGIII